MKQTFLFLLLVALVVIPAFAEDGGGTASVLVTSFENDESPTKAAEYRDTDAGFGFSLDMYGQFGEQGLFLISGHHTSPDEQQYNIRFWTGRHGKIDVSYNEFVHNLIHDPLVNMDAAFAPKANFHTDMNPMSQYGYSVRDLKARMDYAVHGYENLKFFASYSKLEREGMKQVRAMSHCAGCHVNAMDREVNEATEDIEAGASWTIGRLRLMASHLTRSYWENGATPTVLYDLAEHPVQHTPAFNDRISFDISDGPQMVERVPDVEKSQNQVRLDYGWDSGTFTTAYTMAEVTNQTADLSFDYNAWLASGAQRLGEKTWLKLRVRTYEIDNDDYFVDIVEPVAVAGPYAGQTYQEHYGYNPDFLRTSGMNRSVTDGIAEIRYQYARMGSFRFGYRYLSEDRDTYEVQEGETETITGRLYMDWRHVIPKSWKLMASLAYSDISHPFANVNGGCTPDMDTEPVSSPMAPGSIQYWEWQDARQADLSNQPSERMQFRATASRPLGQKTFLMLSTSYTDDKNDELDMSTWDRDITLASAYINWIPSQKWSWFTGYTYMKETTDTHICIPVFDG